MFERYLHLWRQKRFLSLGKKLYDTTVFYIPNQADSWGIAFYDSKRIRDAAFTERGESKTPRFIGKVIKTENGK